MSGRDRLADIDVGKGVAIFLVVLGHVVARDIKPAGNEWFAVFRGGLYQFHMSFFFYLAGYVFWTARPAQFGERARRAAARMLPAYVLIALFAFFAKLAIAPFAPVDRPIRSFWGDWAGLFLYPTDGFITFLWFIIALLGIYALTVAALRWMPNAFGAVVGIAAVLHVLSIAGWVPPLFAMHQIARYWLIFLLARYALEHREALAPLLIRWWPVALIALVASLIWLPVAWQPSVSALIALPALHGLSAAIAAALPRVKDALSHLGAASWPIYLLNAFAIGGVKVIILKTVGWDHARFFIALPLLLAGGLLLPILAQRWVLARIPWLDRITR